MAGKRKGKRQFGSTRTLPSGMIQASYTHPVTKKRVNAPTRFTKMADANAWLAGVQTDITRGVLQAPTVDKMRLVEYVEIWFNSRTKPLKQTSVITYRTMLRRHILPTFGDMALSAIRPSHVEDWYAGLGQKTGPSARAMAYTVLNMIMAAAAEKERIPANPCKIKRGGSTESTETLVLSPAQIDSLANAISPRYRAAVLAATYGHLRHGELAGLRRCDIDFKNRTISTPTQLHHVNGEWVRETPKSRAGVRTLKMPQKVMTTLAKHLLQYVKGDEDALVFTTATGGPVHRTTFNAALKRAGKKVGLQGLHSHVLKHTGLNALSHNGATLKEIMERGGHARAQTAMIYQHVTPERDEFLADQLNNIVGAKTSGGNAAKAM